MKMQDEVADQSAFDLRKHILDEEFSCQELTKFFLERIDEKNPSLHAFLYIDKENALAAAKEMDQWNSQEKKAKPLFGIPFVIPDVLNLKNTPTTFGSKLFEDNFQEQDSHEVSVLKESGAVILGKSSVSEFGFSYDTNNLLAGPCRNPWNEEFSPGGGPGGAAVAIAAGLSPVALNTDFNGGLRMTCSFCGISGLVPSRGRIPMIREHLLPYSERMFYRKGICSRSLRDIAMTLNVLAEPDERDPLCCCELHDNYLDCLSQHHKPVKIALSLDFGFLPVDREVRDAVLKSAKKLEGLGHSVEEVDLDIEEDFLSHFLHIFSADRYVMIMKALNNCPKGFDFLSSDVKEWLQIGNKVTGAQYSMGVAYTEYLANKIDELFEKYDLILTPTVPTPPFSLGQPPSIVDGKLIKPYIGLWSFLIPFNISGHPCITLPCGLSKKGLPIGMQLVGRHLSESLLISVGDEFEKENPLA